MKPQPPKEGIEMTQFNDSTTTISLQPDLPTLGYFADVESAKHRLMSDGGMWKICPVIKVLIYLTQCQKGG